mmetsp:Transcript_39109/g.78970  ORF Transcript_39109/g.78970 Transcript_39109/m.78970 type:complete len:104 (+) Transcript_39109:545-856(+)
MLLSGHFPRQRYSKFASPTTDNVTTTVVSFLRVVSAAASPTSLSCSMAAAMVAALLWSPYSSLPESSQRFASALRPAIQTPYSLQVISAKRVGIVIQIRCEGC